ncbi:hypothetical protein SAMN04489761_3069 [Tenacibaculum sp. MAR_2009_124]|uniref:hypothetical protein n=1 Tax=Tenacibaculum sp. MAR_2009_124 TaxID=1250059 RepID=UPI000894EBF6|nr:hypothetical protein [Tenacibaculum sp. MAR_2009_124]SEC46552.1 hypothetical protein SAMN04489761_3069 [Tenacibaculum sp. MAR_2009_124]
MTIKKIIETSKTGDTIQYTTYPNNIGIAKNLKITEILKNEVISVDTNEEIYHHSLAYKPFRFSIN